MALKTAQSLLLDHLAASGSEIFAYDDVQAPGDVAILHRMQTRAGAGQALAGFVKARSESSAPVVVLASPSAFREIAPVLAELPPKSERAPLVFHVAASEALVDGDLRLVPAIGQVIASLPALQNVPVLLSGDKGPRSILDTVRAVDDLAGNGHDVVHVYDAISAAQEQAAGLSLQAEMEVDAKPVSKGDLSAVVSKALHGQAFFDYAGPTSPRSVLVVPASLPGAVARAALRHSDVGVLTVRVARPWSEKELLAALPDSVTEAHVYTEPVAGGRALYEDVLGTFIGSRVRVLPFVAPADQIWTIAEWKEAIERLPTVGTSASTGIPEVQDTTLLDNESKLAVFWSADDTGSAGVAAHLAERFLSQSDGVKARLLTEYDNFSGKSLGLQRSTLLLPSREYNETGEYVPLDAVASATAPNLLFLSNPASFLSSYAPLESLGAQSEVVFSCNWLPEEVCSKLSSAQKASLVARVFGERKLWVLDAAAVEGARPEEVEQAAFWLLFLGKSSTDQAVASLVDRDADFVRRVRDVLRSFEVPKEGEGQPSAPGEVDAAASAETAVSPPPVRFSANGKGVNPDKIIAEPIAKAASTWHEAAKRLLYSEAYHLHSDTLRPDLPEENFVVTVTESRRLTPLDYDRNVFHMEFSTEGTGLKYAIGEALGVHGHNDAGEVLEFLEWFGLDPDATVSFPNVAGSSDVETRTVFQVFQQNLDIFGRPTRAFYEALSAVASDFDEARTLRFIGSAEGAATFKKMAEVDTVTFADVVRQFPSTKAGLGVDGLIREVTPLKPRHYSIASSQNAVGDSVHLLIVTVDWQTKKGMRYGQCTRYLANLKVGDKVTVSIKPSVMKLPSKDSDPIIMAGLGTGAAPFRAFLQEREWQRNQGIEVGPLLYYFGSRHRSKEYLYGEELEAWLQDGILTKAGLAFSRDGPKKVYIQHKMQEDADLLARLMVDGSFYLCGPTWPVPDVHEAIKGAMMKEGRTAEEAETQIEMLKEHERYVLEVY